MKATMVQVWTGKRARHKIYGIEDFLPEWCGGKKRGKTGKDWKAQLAMIKMLNEAFGGKDMRSAEKIKQTGL